MENRQNLNGNFTNICPLMGGDCREGRCTFYYGDHCAVVDIPRAMDELVIELSAVKDAVKGSKSDFQPL